MTAPPVMVRADSLAIQCGDRKRNLAPASIRPTTRHCAVSPRPRLPRSLFPVTGGCMDQVEQSPITGVRVLVTGGTIDKIYNATGGTLGFERTQVLAMLRQSRVALPEDCVQTVLLKDSLEMEDA